MAIRTAQHRSSDPDARPETDNGRRPGEGDVHPLDARRPVHRILVFGVQHVLVMAATPISSVFLLSATLDLGPGLTANLLAAAFVLSGLGSLLQSLGPWGVGARLPFVMLPGGAPLILFLAIAEQHGARTATGAVLITAAFYFVVLPVFARLLKFFPTLVIGTMIVIVGVNLVKVGATLVTGRPGSSDFGEPQALVMGLATIGFTVAAFRLLRGVLRQLSVMLGLVAGTLLAAALGRFDFSGAGAEGGGLLHVPELMPFGTPEFSLLASVPLLVYSLASMAEATGQTVINSEAVGKEPDARRDAPRTIRGDAVISFAGGFFGLPLMVTSGENIGIVRLTGVRSRYVTVAAGLVLIVTGFLAPVARLVSAVPAPVIGGTAMVVFGVITVLGVQMLGRSRLDDHTNVFIVAVALALGLLPILVPGVYGALPPNARILLESGVAVGACTAAVLHALFHRVPWPSRSGEGAPEADAAPETAPASEPEEEPRTREERA